ncbi:hypothetical protein CYY_008002 [Polysphondylium violaceum]|uniref:GDP-fucose pyrophosphorylase domain-containing protein n=1 Tax=Polysphondylium violaceum TaxID=133409 RepID=A0A8J4PW82_9MYCE|nr:hypothetical protein CYY_008002 [Polysphondylium violaceum]
MIELGFEDNIDILNQYKSIHKRKTNDYKLFLNDNVDNRRKDQFWDTIVITAIDDQQKDYYELVLREKIKVNEIPSFIEYIVISDPKGYKIGCGGSTIYVLSILKEKLGAKFDKSKILLLHAGGYSKRLPNHSMTGKIFASIPYTLVDDGPTCSMLEMKLIMLIDIPKKMKPGVFLACSDDIEIFDSWDIEFKVDNGFIAIAQPGTLDIGTGHGVFVLEELNNFKQNSLNLCKKFIHKPTKEKMALENAILSNGLVLMDSCYYFDHNISSLLLQYYSENNPIKVEIDAYSDFLQPIGKDAKPDYFHSKNNVTTFTPEIAIEREKLFKLLNDNQCKLYMIPYIPSTFIHIGTCHEYIEHFTNNFNKLGFKRILYSLVNNNNDDSGLLKEVTILHSIIKSKNSSIQSNSVIEYCKFTNINLSIGSRCILSDLENDDNNHNNNNEQCLEINIPSNTFIQTQCVSDKYVTIVFGIDDNLKSTTKPLTIFNQPIENLFKTNPIQFDSETHSLWNASIFPICDSPSKSLFASLNLFFNHVKSNQQQHQLYSIERCLMEKNLAKQYQRRLNLTKEIKNNKK